jgi:glycerol-3-phosphate dehydrogenase
VNRACRDADLNGGGGDFASGTSSRSSKLVHGGFRYLRNAKISLTKKSVRERERLIKEGRGLVNPMGILLLNYAGDAIPGWMLAAGWWFTISASKWSPPLRRF